MRRKASRETGSPKRRRGRSLLRLAAIGAIAAWFVNRRQKNAQPEGTWRDMGSKH